MRFIRFILGSALLFAVACTSESVLPTAPPMTPGPPADSSLWWGTWTFDKATPYGDCMAEALNAQSHNGYAPMNVRVHRQGNAVTLVFYATYEDDVGYLPGAFTGTVDEMNRIMASPDPIHGGVFHNQISRHCYQAWTIDGGTLSGGFSGEREIAGVIVESFKAVPGGEVFTINSRFAAKAPAP